jgi:hypothetical protein
MRRPLLKYRRKLNHPFIHEITKDLPLDACILDSGGWIFNGPYNVVESNFIAKKYCKKAIILDYRKQSLNFDMVFAYNPPLLRYVDTTTLENFIVNWTKKKMILYLEKRTIFHNYLKYDLRNLLSLEGFTIDETKIDSFLYKWEIIKI